MEQAGIIIIEDEAAAARTIRDSLRRLGYRIDIAGTRIQGLSMVRMHLPDLVILDIGRPKLEGPRVCREMRNDPMAASVPILFLIEQIKDEEKIIYLNLGSDDFLTKPFNTAELNLRVKAMLRRRSTQRGTNRYPSSSDLSPHVLNVMRKIKPIKKGAGSNQRIVVDEYILHTQTYELYTPDRGKIRLTPIQFSLLYHLMTHVGQIFSPEQLLGDVWNYPSDVGSPDLVRMHIKNLRSRLEADPSQPMFIKTVTGYGYTISPERWENQKET